MLQDLIELWWQEARDQGVLPLDDRTIELFGSCLLYTSDAADDLLCVDLGGRRIIKKKKDITAE